MGGALALSACGVAGTVEDPTETTDEVKGAKAPKPVIPPGAGPMHSQQFGPGPGSKPFKLVKDPDANNELNEPPPGDDDEVDESVAKDPSGYLGLAQTKTTFDFYYVANKDDWNVGSVSKIDTKGVRETARYFSVTCRSNPGGSNAACDGTNGCCARDDFNRYAARKAGGAEGARQGVQQKQNHPSRTALAFDGVLWVANRAFGGQSSVTKIANHISQCIDRNGVAGIQTSSDINGDGVINTDCNGNNIPDDLGDVGATACTNGKPQEFFGLDDDCVLFTTNTGSTSNLIGRPLALNKGQEIGAPNDAWAGLYVTGEYFRIDGLTGLTKADTKVDGHPYGAFVEASGILWTTQVGSGKLMYFDTANPGTAYSARNPSYPLGGYGIAQDRDLNVWVGGHGTGSQAFRYTPNRSGGIADLGTGYWTKYYNLGAATGAFGSSRGIAVDQRNASKYFVWTALDQGGYIVRIPSTDVVPNGIDKAVDGSNYKAVKVAGTNTIGVVVDSDQNVWGASYSGSVVTRIRVNGGGNIPQNPDIVSGTDNEGCPRGDRCTLGLNGVNSSPQPYTYSDATGFGLKNFTLPNGWHRTTVTGCAKTNTTWKSVLWTADEPAGTDVKMRLRSGNSKPLSSAWTAYSTNSPVSVGAAISPAKFLEVEFYLSTNGNGSPKLKNFVVNYTCP